MKTKNIVLIVAGILFFVFLLQNTQVVSVQFLFWKISMSRIILMPIILLIGFVIGLITMKKMGQERPGGGQ